MTINLPPTLERSIRDAVLHGQFASMDDAMIEAARLLLERLQSRPASRPTVTPDDLHRQMLADGLLSQLPDGKQDIDDDEDDEPVEIEGEPLSETIIRERG
jgi:Arc/MetJ-type ribon-helix-helix transcriptional regulator